MTIKRLATVLAVLGGLFLLYAGTSFLLAPQATAEGFGLPTPGRRARARARPSCRSRACGTSASQG
jgi:threonine/homoserine/homoserine lactone efflux protein